MQQTNLSGTRVPEIRLGFLEDGEVRSVSTADIFAHGLTVVLGIPGAFTPVCTKRHLPDFISNAAKFEKIGCRQLVCIAPNDPFVLEEWARKVDPAGTIRFLSDGNLQFTRALGLDSANHELFIGTRSQRYLMIVENGTIVRLRVEPNILTYSCSGAEDALNAADALDILMV